MPRADGFGCFPLAAGAIEGRDFQRQLAGGARRIHLIGGHIHFHSGGPDDRLDAEAAIRPTPRNGIDQSAQQGRELRLVLQWIRPARSQLRRHDGHGSDSATPACQKRVAAMGLENHIGRGLGSGARTR